MNSAYIFILVWQLNSNVQPVVQMQEVNSLDTCRSMSIEVTRMVEASEATQLKVGRTSGNYKVFCHPKEIK